MSRDRLYQLAFAYRAAKLWKRLYDQELFAVTLSSGRIGYCCVMGNDGPHHALALYPGREELESYFRLFTCSPDEVNTLRAQEIMHGQDCLQCALENKDRLTQEELDEAHFYGKAQGVPFRGKNSFPQFVRYRPMHIPEALTDPQDAALLGEALSAALAMASRLETDSKEDCGFSLDPAVIPLLTRDETGGYRWSRHEIPMLPPPSYPTPMLEDELMLARVKRLKRTGAIWHCEVIAHPEPVPPMEAENAAATMVFPFTLFVADLDAEMVYCTHGVPDCREDAGTLLWEFASLMTETSKPLQVLVRDDRTEALLSQFTKAVSVDLVRVETDDILDDVQQQWQDDLADSERSIQQSIAFLSEIVMSLNDEDLYNMPESLWQKLWTFASQGLLPKEMSQRILSLDRNPQDFDPEE